MNVSVPCCKPLRILELISVTLCFSLLFFLRNCFPNSPILLPEHVLIFLFITFGSLLILGAVDVLLQSIKQPTSNLPMILITIFGIVFCTTSGCILIIFYHVKSDSGHIRTLNIMLLLVGGSFFSSTIYFLDTIILFRFLR